MTDTREQLAGRVHEVLDRHWVDEGYAAPNRTVYPWQWLWDSCFHVLVWHELGRTDRAVIELTQALSTQASDGFVPHMNYQRDPSAHADLWGRSGASSITQPPMFGHAVAQLIRAGVDVPDPVIERAVAGVRFLLEVRPRHRSGLVALAHPWESGADDSPRWDDLCPGGFEVGRWRDHKNRLVTTVERSAAGSPLANPEFDVGGVGFSALVAFNGAELDDVLGEKHFGDAVAEVTAAIDRRWEPDRRCWNDAGPAADGSGRIRTADSLLPLLLAVDERHRAAAVAELTSADGFAAPFGPRGVHSAEPVHDPDGYWRGPCWPQLAYLLWWALMAAGRPEAHQLAASTVDGARASGLAEYWNADTGAGLGAVPQSWAGVVLLMDTGVTG